MTETLALASSPGYAWADELPQYFYASIGLLVVLVGENTMRANLLISFELLPSSGKVRWAWPSSYPEALSSFGVTSYVCYSTVYPC